MKRELHTQLVIASAIVLGGMAVLGAEYWLLKWYPQHRQRVTERVLTLLPYRNDGLGVDLQVAAGIYGRVDSFQGGVRIYRPTFWSVGPSLTLTSQPNPDQAVEFAPEVLAKWQTQGIYNEIPRYRFARTKINGRDAVLIWQFQGRAMLLTARVISPERIIEANCTPGQADEALYLEACESSLRTLKLAGPEPLPPPEAVYELTAAGTSPAKRERH